MLKWLSRGLHKSRSKMVRNFHDTLYLPKPATQIRMSSELVHDVVERPPDTGVADLAKNTVSHRMAFIPRLLNSSFQNIILLRNHLRTGPGFTIRGRADHTIGYDGSIISAWPSRSHKVSEKSKPQHRAPLQSAFQVAGIPDKYKPRAFESTWYEKCVLAGYFDPLTSSHQYQPKFSVLLPPPNVTGSLHLGHVLTVAIQDAIVRHRRMSGYAVNWLPGLDHAGIATQIQVEKHLAATQNNITRREVGRERFVEECWAWKEKRAAQIVEQLSRVGASLNWNKMTFTLDPDIVAGVKRVFIELFDRGLIYRDKIMVMHCPYLCSTVSDIEVDWLDIEQERDVYVPSSVNFAARVGYMLHFAYKLQQPVAYGDVEEIVVATTRPETMVGDVAVAVHPDDTRYAHLIGRLLQHPFVAGKTLPIIADTYVDPKFGTGAMKITPAHDFNDFEMAKRHSLPLDEQVIDENGNIRCQACPEIHNQNRFYVRNKIEEMLRMSGLLRHRQSIKTQIPICSRSQDIVEPMLKEQWFMSSTALALEASNAVDLGHLQFTPPFFASVWRNWMQKRQDWCLSRQLWWGIQIPAFEVKVNQADTHSMWICATNEQEACQKALKRLNLPNDTKIFSITRDADVLDTWFSSGCLPFLTSTSTSDPHCTYPLSLMETGHDIIFFWVARMVMLGIAYTGQLPFNRVLLHGLLCDEHGKKMTKSKGNVVDPMKILYTTALEDDRSSSEKTELAFEFDIGADAMRFALLRHDILAVQLDLNAQRSIEAANKFCNKIWQSVRFMLGVWNANGCSSESINTTTAAGPTALFLSTQEILQHCATSTVDRWILSRLADTARIVDESLRETFNMQQATDALHRFWLENVCDVYIECVKPFVQEGPDLSSTPVSVLEGDLLHLPSDTNEGRKVVIRSVLHHVACTYLHLLHPFMPFITDELYSYIPNAREQQFGSLCMAPFPTPELLSNLVDTKTDSAFKIVLRCIHEFRSLKSRYNVLNLSLPAKIIIFSGSEDADKEAVLDEKFFASIETELKLLARLPNVEIIDQNSEAGTSLVTASGSDKINSEAVKTLLGTGYGISAVTRNIYVAVKLEGYIDFAQEYERVVKKYDKLAMSLDKVDRKLRRKHRSDQQQELEAKRTQIVDELKVLAVVKEQLSCKPQSRSNIAAEIL